MINRYDAKRPAVRTASRRLRSGLISRGQSMVEFALMSIPIIMVLFVGIQFAIIGQAALAVSQGSSALARYAAVNPGALGTNGTVTLTPAAQQLLSSSILTGTNDSDLTVTIASYTGTTTTTTSSPGYTDRVVITLSYNAASKIALPNPFLRIPGLFGGVQFPTALGASDSQMYE
jgi:Flp pilus assembly protein TadG